MAQHGAQGRSSILGGGGSVVRRRGGGGRAVVAWLLVAAMAVPAPALARPVQVSKAAPQEAPLLGRVPANAIVYVAWGGTGSEAYRGSKLAKLAASPEMNELLGKTIPGLISSMGDEKAAAQYEKVSAVIFKFASRPGAIYVLPPVFRQGEAPTPPVLMAMIDGGDEADAIVKQIGDEFGPLAPPSGVSLSRDGNVLVLRGGEVSKDVVAGGLAERASFKSAMSAVGGPSQVSAFIDVGAIVALAAGADPRANEVIEAAGLKALQTLSVSAGFDQRGEWASRGLLGMNATRTGVVGALFEKREGMDALLARVPADATMVTTVTLDVPKVFDEVVKAIAVVEPRVAERAPTVWSIAAAATGVQLRTNLLEAVSPQWAVYEPAGMPGKQVAINVARDAAKASQSLEILARSAQRFALMSQQGKPAGSMPKLSVTSTDVGGGKVTTLSVSIPENQEVPVAMAGLMTTTVAFGSKDNVLVIGNDAAAVTATLTAPAQSITSATSYKEVMARVGAPAGASVGFFDLPRSVPAGRKVIEDFIPNIQPMQAGTPFAGVDLNAIVKAVYDPVMPLMTPAGEVRWVDDAGLHFSSVAPFPGAELYSGHGSTAGVAVAGSAVMVGILLPSLNRSRETANRVRSASNLRQIGMGIQLHALENKGAYPEALGELLKGQNVTLEVFVSSRTATKIPPEVLQGTAEAKSQWASAEGDYVYLGKGLKNDAHPNVIVAHERLDRGLRDGVNVLFGDGRVEFIRMADLPEMLKVSESLR